MVNILVIDDEPSIREFPDIFSAEKGTTLVEDAVSGIANWEKTFDIVLTDLRMPEGRAWTSYDG